MEEHQPLAKNRRNKNMKKKFKVKYLDLLTVLNLTKTPKIFLKMERVKVLKPASNSKRIL